MSVNRVILSLVISLTMVAGVSSEIWYTQTFDDLQEGPLAGQDEWAGSATVQSELFRGQSGQSISVTGNISRTLDEHEDVQYVSFCFMVSEEAAMDWKLYMGDVAQNQAAAMGLNPDNETLHIHGGDEQIPVNVEPEEWYQLGAVFDFNSKTWTLYFSDMENPLREGKGFRNAACSVLSNMWLTIWTNPTAGGLYVDDFVIGDGDVIPTTADPVRAVNPALKLATLWGEIRSR